MKPSELFDLSGKVAIVTGAARGLGKIIALALADAGADVVIGDILMPLAEDVVREIEVGGNRALAINLDVTRAESIQEMVDNVTDHFGRIDILINNAAQTVRRPPGFYAHLLMNESKDYDELPSKRRKILESYRACLNQIGVVSAKSLPDDSSSLSVTWKENLPGVGLRSSAELSQIPYVYDHALAVDEVFPAGRFDADLQQIDLRETNSWRLKLGEIDTAEMIEVQLVNAVAPFVLCNKLAGMMKKDYTGQKHMVNVTAMEGKFLRFKTNGRHPHTNMAKAALNMLTNTCANDFAKFGIFVNAVDTGWITDEDPAVLAKLKQDRHDFQPPLDIMDGAARICDPFFDGILTGKHWCGKFLKDYFPIDW